MTDKTQEKACILAGECGCAYGAEWSRALALADDAAESVIRTEGHSPRERQWVLYPEQIAADPYLEDAIAHLEWRGIAKAVRGDDRVTVIFEENAIAALRERLGEKA